MFNSKGLYSSRSTWKITVVWLWCVFVFPCHTCGCLWFFGEDWWFKCRLQSPSFRHRHRLHVAACEKSHVILDFADIIVKHCVCALLGFFFKCFSITPKDVYRRMLFHFRKQIWIRLQKCPYCFIGVCVFIPVSKCQCFSEMAASPGPVFTITKECKLLEDTWCLCAHTNQ